MLVPAAVIAASRSFTVASVAMSAPFQICVKSVALYRVDLAEPQQVALLAGERRAGEGLDQFGCDRGPDHAGADAEHVAVVVADALLGRVVVVGHGRADARDLAARHRDARAAAAHDDAALGLALDDGAADRERHIRVVVGDAQVLWLVAGRLQRRDHRLAEWGARVIEGAGDVHRAAASSVSASSAAPRTPALTP